MPRSPLSNIALLHEQTVATYEAALLLDERRVRGVGYHPIEVTRWYKVRIPKGWHQNILDPNAEGDDGNRHEPLPDFAPDGLEAFVLVARLRGPRVGP